VFCRIGKTLIAQNIGTHSQSSLRTVIPLLLKSTIESRHKRQPIMQFIQYCRIS